MANRDENLKKINAELEKLSDDELEKIAGGTVGETMSDKTFLKEHGLVSKFEQPFFKDHFPEDSGTIKEGWAKVGITCVTHPLDRNKYYFENKEISRDEAFKIVKEKFSKT
ncbi:MAG: hypothetical protein IJU55_00410 [Selenomonadaceae bacterium]|nr:hypothetical protein [Selenomonadaceae bacterium]